MYTGKHLIEWGFQPRKGFATLVHEANVLHSAGKDENEIILALQAHVPVLLNMNDSPVPIGDFIRYTDDPSMEEIANVLAVRETMHHLARLPTVKSGAIMPDACVAGTIPVGGVVATENAIHPGFHSADICCSMAISIFNRKANPKNFLDDALAVTHFGPIKKGGAQRFGMEPSLYLLEKMERNRFLKDLVPHAISAFMTQGDGNHHLFVGHLESSGELAVVTHHGSRSLGALLYKRGTQAARKHTSIVAPRIHPSLAWIEADSEIGQAYWEALQIVRLWTKENHFRIHEQLSYKAGNKIVDRLWNEHNFVFQKSDGLFYHAKGATPSYNGFASDDSGTTIIPMNMEEPILLTRHTNNPNALGFAPHGAGRNMSRTAFLKQGEPPLPKGVDYRFFCGEPDPSEYPAAYKSAAHVTGVIQDKNLAEIYDRVLPYGSIMAGNWEKNAPWKKTTN